MDLELAKRRARMKVKFDRISPEKDPGDYYENKRREAEAVQAALNRHQVIRDHHPGSGWLCRRCRELERQLEQARYVGD